MLQFTWLEKDIRKPVAFLNKHSGRTTMDSIAAAILMCLPLIAAGIIVADDRKVHQSAKRANS